MKSLFAFVFVLGIVSPPVLAGQYFDPQTNFTIKFDETPPAEVLSLLTKTFGQLDRRFFRSATIMWTRDIGAGVYAVRTSSRMLLVQTDIGRVDDLDGRVLKVWNDIVLVKRHRYLVTLNRKTFTQIQEFKLPIQGEGEDKWSLTPTGDSLLVRMHWEPSMASYYGQIGCQVVLGIVNPVSALPPYVPVEHLDAGTYTYSVSADGSISVVELGLLDSVLGLVGL